MKEVKAYKCNKCRWGNIFDNEKEAREHMVSHILRDELHPILREKVVQYTDDRYQISEMTDALVRRSKKVIKILNKVKEVSNGPKAKS